LREGDQAVFRSVFYEYHEKIHAYVLRKTNSAYIADETLQLTFIKLWNYRNNLSDDLSLFTQLFRIVRTTMIDLIRKEQTKTATLHKYNQKPVFTNNANEKLEENELKRKINSLLQQMPGMQKKVFEMNRFEGMSYRDIADTLSISIKTVETHISRALRFLRQHLTLLTILLHIIP
jgi:RNA polymerase sigma-70 factor (family 1)